MLKYSQMNPVDAKFNFMKQLGFTSDYFLKSFSCKHRNFASSDTIANDLNLEKQRKPSLRGFVYGVAQALMGCQGNSSCLANIDPHFKEQSLKCSICSIPYYAIGKVRIFLV